MRLGNRATLVAFATFALAGVAGAQSTVVFKMPSVPSRFTLGADAAMVQPKGEFANNIGRGWGFNGTGLFRLDEKGYVQLRADGGLAQYGREVKRIPLNPITGRVEFKVETTNMIGWVGFGGQLQIPDGPFRPYVNGSIAYTDFATESSLTGSDGSDLGGLSTRNQHDGSHAWIYGTGVNIPFGKKFTSGMLNFGARYYSGGQAAYLKKGDIIDNPDGTISFTPRRSKTDMILWQLGASFTLPR
jgi:hypothetical protein